MLSNVTTAQLQKPAMAVEANGRPIDSSSAKGKVNGYVIGRGPSGTKSATPGYASKSFSLIAR